MPTSCLSSKRSVQILFLVIFIFTLTSTAPPKSDLETQEMEFTAKGLYFEKFLTNIYTGNFLEIPFDRDDMKFMLLYETYLKAYAKSCDIYLPATKVEIMRDECVTEEVTKDQYGWEISRTCIEWVKVGTGLYADPDMYNAKLSLDRLQAGDAVRNVFRMITQQNPVEGAQNLLQEANAAKIDMDALLQMNRCDSPGIKRFAENLKLFALNKQPIRLGAENNTETSGPSGDQNYRRLVEHLVYDHSTTWVMNRYDRGSTNNARVTSMDSQGRPRELVANYTYMGFSGRTRGTVRVTFTDGLPECMFFADFPNTCRTPSRRIVAQFAQGAYNR